MAKSKGKGKVKGKAPTSKVPATPGTAPYQMTNPGVKGYGSQPKQAGR